MEQLGLTWTAGQTIAVRLTLDVPGIDSIAFSSSPATGTTYRHMARA